MSSNKTIAQLRRFHDYRIVSKYTRLYNTYNEEPLKVPGKTRKHNPFNCGQSRCKLCSNPRRTRGTISFPEMRINEVLKQELREVSFEHNL